MGQRGPAVGPMPSLGRRYGGCTLQTKTAALVVPEVVVLRGWLCGAGSCCESSVTCEQRIATSSRRWSGAAALQAGAHQAPTHCCNDAKHLRAQSDSTAIEHGDAMSGSDDTERLERLESENANLYHLVRENRELRSEVPTRASCKISA